MNYYYKMIDDNGEFYGLCESAGAPLSNPGDIYVEIPYDEYLKIREEKGMGMF